MLNNFTKRKQDGETWFSPGIYTPSSSGGYKLHIYVNCGGRRKGKGSHISCFVQLMPGKNDDTLEWPFRGDVAVVLLNQLEDRNHYEHIFKLDANPYKKNQLG